MNFIHADDATRNKWRGGGSSNQNNYPGAINRIIAAFDQTGTGTLVGGTCTITKVDDPILGLMAAPLVLTIKSRIYCTLYTYDMKDNPILAITARTNGAAGTATFTVGSNSSETSSFDFLIKN